jgi:hypothetical protein
MTIKAVTQRRKPIYHNICSASRRTSISTSMPWTYAVAAYQELKPAYPALKKAYDRLGSFDRFDSATGKRLMRPASSIISWRLRSTREAANGSMSRGG